MDALSARTETLFGLCKALVDVLSFFLLAPVVVGGKKMKHTARGDGKMKTKMK